MRFCVGNTAAAARRKHAARLPRHDWRGRPLHRRGAIILTDKAASHAEVILATLEMAMAHRVPTAMMSQGDGPLRSARLLGHARVVLPRVGLIALREGVFGLERLAVLGVRPERMVMPAVRAAVHEAVRRLGAAPVPLPLAFHAAADYPLFIREVLRGLDDASDGGQDLGDPVPLVEAAGRRGAAWW
jgi:Polysaccharide pyruvyl transferase